VFACNVCCCVQFIAEDTRGHSNNLLWAYNLAASTPTLTRILSAPRYAEVTGQWMTYWGEHAYLTVAMQHPGDVDEDALVSSPGALPVCCLDQFIFGRVDDVQLLQHVWACHAARVTQYDTMWSCNLVVSCAPATRV
jgi:hypothetical protein